MQMSCLLSEQARAGVNAEQARAGVNAACAQALPALGRQRSRMGPRSPLPGLQGEGLAAAGTHQQEELSHVFGEAKAWDGEPRKPPVLGPRTAGLPQL